MKSKSDSFNIQIIVIKAHIRLKYLLQLFLGHATSLINYSYFEEGDLPIIHVFEDSGYVQYYVLVARCEFDGIW